MKMNQSKMNNKDRLKFDILKGRREELKIPQQSLTSFIKLRNIGLTIACTMTSFTICLSLIFLVEGILIKRKINSLKPYVAIHESLFSKINKIKSETNNIKKYNKNIANSILSIKSSSAILTEISKIVPEGIILDEIDITNNDILINGQIKNMKDLLILNLFDIQLSNSPFIERSSVKLINANKPAQSEKIKDSDPLKFLISASFITDFSNINKKYLDKLGSFGLATRLNILKEQGLIKDKNEI